MHHAAEGRVAHHRGGGGRFERAGLLRGSVLGPLVFLLVRYGGDGDVLTALILVS